MNEIFQSYKDWCSANEKNKKGRISKYEIGIFLAFVVLFIFFIYKTFYCMIRNETWKTTVDTVVFVALGFFLVYLLNRKQSAVFSEKNLYENADFEKLKTILKNCGIESAEEIQALQEWCEIVCSEETPANKFIGNMEKELTIFLVPSILLVADYWLNKTEFDMGSAIYIMVASMLACGVLCYSIVPYLKFKKSDRDIIEKMKRDLAELSIYNIRKAKSANIRISKVEDKSVKNIHLEKKEIEGESQ